MWARGYENIMNKYDAHKILVIQPMVGIGDMVWHKPWLDQIVTRRNITLMAKPSSQAASVLCDHPNLDIIALHRSERGRRSDHDGWAGFFKMVAAMRAVKADEVWIMHKSWRYAVAALFAGIRKRAGYGFGKQRYFLNCGMALDPSLKKAHPRETAAIFCAQFDIKPKDSHPHITPDEDMRIEAKTVAPKGTFIVMGVGAADGIRRWSPRHFAGLIAKLRKSHPEIDIVLCGSPQEAEIGLAIITALAAIDAEARPPSMMFDQSVKTVIAVHERAELYIGNDTSLINIAAAVGTNAIRIFASSLSVLNSPLIETYLPENPDRMDIPGAIDDIDDDRIHKAAIKYLD